MTKARDIADLNFDAPDIDGGTIDGATINAPALTVDTDTLVVNETTHRTGVGTSSPSRLFTVEGGSGDNLPARIIGGSGTSKVHIEFQDPTTTADYKVTVGSVGDHFSINAGGSERVRVLDSGRVAIGSTVASASLDVRSASSAASLGSFGGTAQTNFAKVNLDTDTLTNNAYLIAYGSGNVEDGNFAIKNTSGDLFFTAGGAEQFRLKANGNIIVNPQSSGFTSLNNGVVNDSIQIHTNFSGGEQNVTLSQLDGNHIDGTTGSDTQFGWVYNYGDSVRGGLIYDHRGSERMSLFSSYGKISILTNPSLSGNAVPIDSAIQESVTITPIGNVGIGNDNPQSNLVVQNSNGVTSELVASDGGGSPAMTATYRIKGYEGRGAGLKIQDHAMSASSPDNREWFVGTGYNTSNFGIGYSYNGVQSEYISNNKLAITPSGQVVIPNGVTLGTNANQYVAANTIHDYEEGTWTPSAVGATSSGTTSYSVREGNYTKIGNKVHCFCMIHMSGMTGSGTLHITGLPFTSDGEHTGDFQVNQHSSNFPSSICNLSSIVQNGDTHIHVRGTYYNTSSGPFYVPCQTFTYLRINITYKTTQ